MWLDKDPKTTRLVSRYSTRARKCNNSSTCETGRPMARVNKLLIENVLTQK